MTDILKFSLTVIFDSIIIILFFKPIIPQKKANRWESILSYFILTLVFFLLIDESYSSTISFLIRWAIYSVYLYLHYHLSTSQTLYYGLFGAFCFTATFGIYCSSLLFGDIQKGVVLLSSNPILNIILSYLLQFVVRGIMMFIVSLIVPLKKLPKPNYFSWFSLSLTSLSIIYVRYAIHSLNYDSVTPKLKSGAFSLLLNIFFLAFILSQERFRYVSANQKEVEIQSALNEERIRSMQESLRNSQDIRQIHHDMKNHLLAIHSLTNASKNDKASEYIDNLIADLKDYEKQIETGNPLLNSLIGSKMAIAHSKNINMSLIANFTALEFISDNDICTIFGNALDNAIEACEKVKTNPRYIKIKSDQRAGQFIIDITNNYVGAIEKLSALPVTSKKEAWKHGIGLSNIRRAVHKYNGEIVINADNPQVFVLSIIIPLPDKSTNNISQ